MNFFGDPVDGALIADYVQPVGGGGRVRLLNWSVNFRTQICAQRYPDFGAAAFGSIASRAIDLLVMQLGLGVSRSLVEE